MKLIVFDVDGTLVDSQHLIVAAQGLAFAENGLPAPGRREALSVVGLSLPQAFRRLVGEDGPIVELSESYKQAYNRLRVDPAYEEPLFPGMGELLARLHAREDVLIGLATGKSRRGVDRLIAHHGWADWFVTTQSADDAPSKPDPTMLLQAMAEAGCAPEATVMVGDTTFDIGMGVSAGAVAVGVGWGYHPAGALYGAGAVTVVSSAGALEGLLSGGSLRARPLRRHRGRSEAILGIAPLEERDPSCVAPRAITVRLPTRLADEPESSYLASMSDVTNEWLGEPGDGERPDPVRAARGHAKPALPRRFYQEAGFAEGPDGFRLTLDGRPANTPARNPLSLPTRALAEKVAAEWAAQDTVIDPARMPLTRLANTSIDGVAPRHAAVVEDLCAYAGTDLLAYRAGDPERLVSAQAASWDPILDWARETFGARIILSEGVMHVEQPPDTVRALSEAVAAVESPFRLAGLHTLTTLTGSLLIALAVLRGRLSPAEAWDAAHVDETYQAAIWGSDAEAEARLAIRRTEFEAAAELIANV